MNRKTHTFKGLYKSTEFNLFTRPYPAKTQLSLHTILQWLVNEYLYRFLKNISFYVPLYRARSSFTLVAPYARLFPSSKKKKLLLPPVNIRQTRNVVKVQLTLKNRNSVEGNERIRESIRSWLLIQQTKRSSMISLFHVSFFKIKKHYFKNSQSSLSLKA